MPSLERVSRTASEDHRPEVHRLLARAYQALAAAFVRQNEADAAWVAADRAIREAELADGRLGVLEFGPTNVEVQAVATAVDLGDAGEALDIAKELDASRLSGERQARLPLDVGRAYTQRRQFGDALECLLRAEVIAPELIRNHMAARGVIRELMLMAGRTASPELRGLAERSDAMGWAGRPATERPHRVD